MADRYEPIPVKDTPSCPIPLDKFQPISIDAFVDEVEIERQHRESLAALLPVLTPFIEARDAAVEEIATVEARIAELQGQVEGLREEADSLGGKATETVTGGGDSTKLRAKRKATEIRADAVMEEIADLQAHLEGLYAKGNSAEFNLFEAWQAAQRDYTAEAQQALNARLRELSVYLIAHARGMQKTYKAILRPGEFPAKFCLSHAQLQNRKAFAPLQFRSRASILGVQERFSHQILGGLA